MRVSYVLALLLAAALCAEAAYGPSQGAKIAEEVRISILFPQCHYHPVSEDSAAADALCRWTPGKGFHTNTQSQLLVYNPPL
jgi:hypothetical protein